MLPELFLVKAPVVPKPGKAQPVTTPNTQPSQLWMSTSGVLFLVMVSLAVYSKLQLNKLEKKLRFEQFRSREVQKKLKLALETISKIESNPDLINSRDINLDYIRMRMTEEVFNLAIVNQIKVKVRDKISQVLRPSQAHQGTVGVASGSGRQVDATFDVEYETPGAKKHEKKVLFRVQIRLIKLPNQTTANIINQVINCIQTYLNPAEDHHNWQPTIQERLVFMHWDQKAKPTPMLVIEQTMEGVNVAAPQKRKVTKANIYSSQQAKTSL